MLHVLTSLSAMMVPANGSSIRVLELSQEKLLKIIEDILRTDWRNTSLQAAVSLILGCFIEELRLWTLEMEEEELRTQDWISILDGVAKEEEVERWAEEAIKKEALVFMKDCVVKHVNQTLCSSYLDEQDRDFYEECIIPTLDVLISNFIVKMSRPIRRLKFLEEDKRFGGTDTSFQRHAEIRSQHTYYPGYSLVTPSMPVLRDLEILMNLVADLYRDRPDLATRYWYREGKLYLFVKWCSDCKPITTICSFTKMLGSLACGSECAQHAFNFLNAPMSLQMNPTLSWNALFEALQNYYQALSDTVDGYPLSSTLKTAPLSGWKEIHPDEVVLLQNFLDILCQILSYSESSRIMLFESVQWNALNRLFGLLSCNIPVSLKAYLFDCLAAFALSSDIAMYIWQLLEVAEVLGKVDPKTGKVSGGIKYELEEIESRDESYLESRAFLHLLLKIVIASGGSNAFKPWTNSNAFMNYIEFVVNDIICRASSRGYIDSTEKWELLDISLQIVSRLMNFWDVETETAVFPGPKGIQRSPGHDLLLLMLSNDTLVEELLKIIVPGPLAIVDNRFRTVHFANCVCEVLRIFEYILRSQEFVLNRVMSGEKIRIYRPLEQILLARHDILGNIPSFISCYGREDIALWSIKVVYRFLRSSHLQDHTSQDGNLFVRLLKTQKTINYIKTIYAERLLVEEPSTELFDAETKYDSQTILQMVDPPANSQSIRTAILELLIEGLTFSSPNLSESLLGLDLDDNKSSITIPDPLGPTSQQNCFYALLDVLRRWTELPPDAKIYTKFRSKSMELLYHLCSHGRLSSGILRYLRTREDFFGRVIESMQFDDQPQFPQAPSAICRIYETSWFLLAFAIDLHMATMTNQRSYMTKVLNAFFGLSEITTTTLVPGVFASDRLLYILKNLASNWIPKMESQPSLPPDTSGNLLEDIDQAQTHLFSSWRSLFGVIITRCYEIFPLEWRNSISVNCLCTILSVLKNTTFPREEGEKLSEIVSLLVFHWRTQIESARHLRKEFTMKLGFAIDLIVPLFSSMIDLILSTGSTVGFRANIHASLVNFLRIIQSWAHGLSDEERSKIPLFELEQIQAAHATNVAYVETHGYRLVTSMAMDLLEGPDVWKTVIFTSMDMLISYSSQIHSNGLLHIFIKRNVIYQLVQLLKKEDLLLQSIIGYASTSLNPLYIYESKMTFFLHVASDKDGSMHLKECELIEVLCENKALDLIPERPVTIQGNHFSELVGYYIVELLVFAI